MMVQWWPFASLEMILWSVWNLFMEHWSTFIVRVTYQRQVTSSLTPQDCISTCCADSAFRVSVPSPSCKENKGPNISSTAFPKHWQRAYWWARLKHQKAPKYICSKNYYLNKETAQLGMHVQKLFLHYRCVTKPEPSDCQEAWSLTVAKIKAVNVIQKPRKCRTLVQIHLLPSHRTTGQKAKH